MIIKGQANITPIIREDTTNTLTFIAPTFNHIEIISYKVIYMIKSVYVNYDMEVLSKITTYTGSICKEHKQIQSNV